MTQIVISILAVVLLMLVVVGGISYLDPNATARQKIQADITTGFSTLNAAFSGYRMATGLTPTDPNENDATTVTKWKSELFPYYGDMPTTIGTLTWSYGSDSQHRWFCLSGETVSEQQYRAMANVSKNQPDTYFVGTDCGDSTETFPADNLIFPTRAAITYRVSNK